MVCEQLNNVYLGSVRSLRLFVTFKAPVLIVATLGKTLLQSNVFHLSIKESLLRGAFLRSVVVTPVIEEILFRGLLQQGIKKILRISFERFNYPDLAENRLEREKFDQIMVRTARLASCILFGLAHLPVGGVVQAILAGIGSYYGEAELMEGAGITASIGCHFTNNLICHISEILIK